MNELKPAKISLKLIALRLVLGLCGLAALGTVVFVGLNTITGGPKLSHQMMATVTAPGGRLKAVLTRIGGGDAANFGYVVDVVAAANDGDTARVANVHADRDTRAAVLEMIWTDSRTLVLRSPRGTIAQQEPGDVTVAGEPVTVVLKPQ